MVEIIIHYIVHKKLVGILSGLLMKLFPIACAHVIVWNFASPLLIICFYCKGRWSCCTLCESLYQSVGCFIGIIAVKDMLF